MAYPMIMPGTAPSGEYPPLGFPESFGSGLQAPPTRGGMFGRVGRTNPSFVSDGAGYGLPQLSSDVVAAGQSASAPGGFFSEGGTGRAIAGAIGDYLSQIGGGQAIYAPIVQQRRMLQQQQVKRQNDWEDFVRQAQWERDHPKPSTAQPYRFEDNAGNQWEMGPDGTPRLIFTDRAPKQLVANGQLITSTNPYVDAAPMQTGSMPRPGDILDDPRLASQGGGVGNDAGGFRP